MYRSSLEQETGAEFLTHSQLSQNFVLSATSLLRSVSKRKGALADWISALLAKKPARLVSVALANKLARIIWAIMRTGEIFRAEIFAKA
jgi:transposase